MEYDNPHSTIVDIVYEDDHHYSFDYKMEVDNDTHKIKFLTHYCEYATDHIDLKRDKTFETAVS